MADRLTISEFFAALKSQSKVPFIDTPEVRNLVLEKVRKLTINYPIQDRWPVLDLETAYERYLNNSPDIVKFARLYGYRGVINLQGFDETYTMSEWFGDFIVEYKLNDNSIIRSEMQKILPYGDRWKASMLYEAYMGVAKKR